MTDQGGEFSFFRGIYVTIDIEIDKHFYKTHDLQIWEAGTSIGFYSNQINQAGAGDDGT